MKLSEEIKKFQKDVEEARSISSNLVSQAENQADKIIKELLKIVEEQNKVAIEAIIALGDNEIYRKFEHGSKFGEEEGLTKHFARMLAKDFDEGVSHSKKMENAFYSLQKIINKTNFEIF